MDQPGRIIEVAQLLNEKPLGEGAFSLGAFDHVSSITVTCSQAHGEDSGCARRVSSALHERRWQLQPAHCAEIMPSQHSQVADCPPLSCQCLPVQ